MTSSDTVTITDVKAHASAIETYHLQSWFGLNWDKRTLGYITAYLDGETHCLNEPTYAEFAADKVAAREAAASVMFKVLKA